MEFWQLALSWVRWREGSGGSPRGLYEDRLRLRNHILPFCGDWELERFARADARALYLRVATGSGTGRRGHAMGGHGAARRVVRQAAAMLSHAVEIGELDVNPWHGWRAPSGDGMRSAVIRGRAEYAGLEDALDGLEFRWMDGDRRGGIRPAVADLFRLLACTGLRLGEAQALEWPEVDLAGRQLMVLRSKAKALGRQSIESMDVPPLGMGALRRRWAADGGVGLVFKPERGERMSCQREWVRVREAAGLHPQLTIHGLRHSLGTHAIANGASALEVQQMLRHASPATTARYVHLGAVQRGMMTRNWERITGNEPEPAITRGGVVMAPAEGRRVSDDDRGTGNADGRTGAGGAAGGDAGGPGERAGDEGAEQGAGGGAVPPRRS